MPLTPDEVQAILRDCGSLLDGHFLLTSGRHSNRFILLAQALQHPAQAERLCRALAEPFQGQGILTVMGPAVGGIILAFEVARALGARGFFAEKTAEGRMALRRGFALRPGERTLVVEDAVSTGGSVSQVIELVRAAGALALGVSVIADRTGGKLKLGLPLHTLLTLDIASWNAEECPLCRAGVPLARPKD